MPTRIRALVKHAKPLAAPSSFQTKDGLDFRSVLSFLVCLCLVLVLYFTQLEPQKSLLEQAQHAMCGGDLDFVYAKDPMGAMWWAPTKKHRDDGLARHSFPYGEKRSRVRGVGYTYAGQIFFDRQMLSSTYPDFDPLCSSGPIITCGNTCCVPVETNETARVAAGG